MKRFSKKFREINSDHLYNSIDELPVYYWNKIHETNEKKYLLKKVVEVENTEQLEALWGGIYDEYLDEFGLSAAYEKIQRKKRQIALLKADFIIKDERVILNFINVEEQELEQIYKGFGGKTSFRENLIKIERVQGLKLNPKQISVADYYNYIRSIQNG